MIRRIELSEYEQSLKKEHLGNSKFFDWKWGSVGAAGTVLGAYYFNSLFGDSDNSSSFLVSEGIKSLILGGTTAKLCEHLATSYESEKISKLAGIVIPSIITLGATYLSHKQFGSSVDWESTIPYVVGSTSSFVWWANRKRNQLENLLEFDD